MNGARRYDAGLFSFVLATWSIFSLKRVPFKLYGLSFRGKARFFRSLRAGLSCVAASRFVFFSGKTL